MGAATIGNWPGSSAAHVGRTIRDVTNVSKRQLIRPSFLLPIELLRTQKTYVSHMPLDRLYSTALLCNVLWYATCTHSNSLIYVLHESIIQGLYSHVHDMYEAVEA